MDKGASDVGRKLGFGLVGLGIVAETHARDIGRTGQGELVAVYGRNEQKAKNFAAKFGAKRWYTDYRRMLEDKEVEIVNILTPNGLHRDFAVAAAEAGKHIVVEKPIDITLERADAIIQACRRHNVKLSVVYQSRFGSAARTIKQALENGAFGKLISGGAYAKKFRRPDYYANDYWRGTKEYEGGGSVITNGIHTIDLLRWFMGPVKSVFAKKRTATHKIEVEDVAVACVSFRNGAVGVIESATCAFPGFGSRVEVNGENGSAIVGEEGYELLFWEVLGSAQRVDTPAHFRGISDPRQYPDRHAPPLQDMIGAISENREPLITGEEARKSLALVLAIYQSAESGGEVEVED